jgi:hypothetical protein
MTDLEWLEGFAKAVLELDIDLSEFLHGEGGEPDEEAPDLEVLVTARVRLHRVPHVDARRVGSHGSP